MASKIEIINHALALLGASRISSLSELTHEATIMSTVYETVRDDLLRSHNWNFAIKRTSLAKLSETPAFEFKAYFQLPTDCLRVIKTNDETAPYKIEGRKLATDENAVKIKYIRNDTVESEYDAQFVTTFAAALALESVPALPAKGSLFQSLGNLYMVRLERAQAMNAIENFHDVITNTTLTGFR